MIAIDAIMRQAINLHNMTKTMGYEWIIKHLFIKVRQLYAPQPLHVDRFIDYMLRTQQPLLWLWPKKSLPLVQIATDGEAWFSLFQSAGLRVKDGTLVDATS